MTTRTALLCLALSTALAGCFSPGDDPTSPANAGNRPSGAGLYGPGAADLGANQPQAGDRIGVNSYLWRAALDTLSFMPLSSADPFGGVIITDWYSPPETPNERFKVNVFILDRRLSADGVRAAIFHQTHATDGRWLDTAVKGTTQTDLENAILTRARQLRVSTAQN